MPPQRVSLHCRHGPANFPEPRSAYAGHTRYHDRLQAERRFLAEIVTESHVSHGTARVCHRRRLSRRQPAAARCAHEFRMHSIRQIRRTGRPVGTTWPAGPPCQCDSVTCEHTLYHPKTDGSERSMAYKACAYSIASAILFQGCLSFAPCTSLQ